MVSVQLRGKLRSDRPKLQPSLDYNSPSTPQIQENVAWSALAFNAAIVLLLFSLVYSIVSYNSDLINRTLGWSLSLPPLRLLDMDAAASLLAALLSAKYLVSQLSRSYAPYLSYRNKLVANGALGSRPIEYLTTDVMNAGSGPATRLVSSYWLEWIDDSRNTGRWLNSSELDAELERFNFKQGDDFVIGGVGAGGAIAAGSTIEIGACSANLIAHLKALDLILTFEGQFGGKHAKLVVIVPYLGSERDQSGYSDYFKRVASPKPLIN